MESLRLNCTSRRSDVILRLDSSECLRLPARCTNMWPFEFSGYAWLRHSYYALVTEKARMYQKLLTADSFCPVPAGACWGCCLRPSSLCQVQRDPLHGSALGWESAWNICPYKRRSSQSLLASSQPSMMLFALGCAVRSAHSAADSSDRIKRPASSSGIQSPDPKQWLRTSYT